MLEDLRGSQRPEESLFIAAQLGEAAGWFHLAAARRWAGKGKWLHSYLRRQDETLAQRLVDALQAVYCDRLTQPLISLVEEILAPYGGALFDGYYSQAPREAED